MSEARPTITAYEMQQLVDKGEAEFVCFAGVQKRPVYKVGNDVYEKAINFNNSDFGHTDYYMVSEHRAELLRLPPHSRLTVIVLPITDIEGIE